MDLPLVNAPTLPVTPRASSNHCRSMTLPLQATPHLNLALGLSSSPSPRLEKSLLRQRRTDKSFQSQNKHLARQTQQKTQPTFAQHLPLPPPPSLTTLLGYLISVLALGPSIPLLCHWIPHLGPSVPPLPPPVNPSIRPLPPLIVINPSIPPINSPGQATPTEQHSASSHVRTPHLRRDWPCL